MTYLALFLIAIGSVDATEPARPVASILSDYVQAVGGQAAADQITSRQMEGNLRRGAKVTLYWQKPNRVLWIGKKERTGFDGARGWTLSSKKKTKKLAKGAELPYEMDANPLRYVHIGDLYSELNPAQAEEIDGQKMDVIVAPNSLSATKLYFNAATHLLQRVIESGETSAYFKNTVDYLDYRAIDGVQLPYRIVHVTTEPGGAAEDLRIKEIKHNVAITEEMFSKPLPGQVITGSKR